MKEYAKQHSFDKMVSSLIFIFMFTVVSTVQASVEPPTFEATLAQKESTTDPIQVNLFGTIPKAEIIFSLDLTGSMYSEILTVKQEITKIMDSLDSVIEDARYGVISYMDYPGYYCSFGYCAQYGHSLYGDYAYSLDSPLTYDRETIKNKVNGLMLGWGADGPEDYARVLHETATDPAIGFSDTSLKILINFGDNLPHDDNVCEESFPGYTCSFGSDPGRDEEILNEDDVDLQAALNEMADNNITLFHVNSNYYYQQFWKPWAAVTGGDSILLSDASQIPNVVLTLIEGMAENMNHVANLSLQIPEDYKKFVSSVNPVEYFNITTPDSVPFDIELTVPEGTEAGVYEFVVTAIGDGLSYGEHKITINVPALESEDPAVDSTFGKITGGGFIEGDAEEMIHNFGFNVHYNDKGEAKMKGQLQFVDRDANSHFHGNQVESLVVEGNVAEFTGTGRFNGAAGFSYMVVVQDNGNPGKGNDTFFIEITNEESGAVVAAKEGILAGGNIKIHEFKPKGKKAKAEKAEKADAPGKAKGKKK